MKKISILIPTIRRHDRLFTRLKFDLAHQTLPYEGIEVLADDHEYDPVGMKRNRLLDRATGEYLCFFDADDQPSADYIEQLMKAVESGKDCASLKGAYSVDGKFDGIFEHSIKYKEWRTAWGEIKYERYPNHLNLVKSSIAKQIRFPEITFGEDKDWSMKLKESGLIKTEHYIPEIIYYYNYVTNKK
jgi:glycosyltransferase involved in cell wall biosynthesis